jgi:hypothetical protein
VAQTYGEHDALSEASHELDAKNAELLQRVNDKQSIAFTAAPATKTTNLGMISLSDVCFL